jgi:hypothetical protein
MKNFKLGFGFWVGIGTILLIVLLIWAGGAFNKAKIAKEEALPSRATALSCTTDMATQFHIHPMLSIVLNGKKEVIPANIGITDICMHPLHTHDDTGTIHVESPVEKDFTLGDFFAVWGKDFSNIKILDYTADANRVITMTVNGVKVDTFENTILKDKDQIVITYGPKS